MTLSGPGIPRFITSFISYHCVAEGPLKRVLDLLGQSHTGLQRLVNHTAFVRVGLCRLVRLFDLLDQLPKNIFGLFVHPRPRQRIVAHGPAGRLRRLIGRPSSRLLCVWPSCGATSGASCQHADRPMETHGGRGLARSRRSRWGWPRGRSPGGSGGSVVAVPQAVPGTRPLEAANGATRVLATRSTDLQPARRGPPFAPGEHALTERLRRAKFTAGGQATPDPRSRPPRRDILGGRSEADVSRGSDGR
jgi:hypothetical protein